MTLDLAYSQCMEDSFGHAEYMREIGYFIRELAKGAKLDVAAASEDERAFSQGRLMAYHEVISLLREHALYFRLHLEDISLEGFDPDRDLL